MSQKRYKSASSRREAPELCVNRSPKKTEGVGTTGSPSALAGHPNVIASQRARRPDDRLGVPHLFIVGERRTVCSTAGAYHRRRGLNAQLRTGHRDTLARTQLRSPRRSVAGERRCSMTFAQLPSSWVPAWRNIDIRGWPPTRAAPIIGPAEGRTRWLCWDDRDSPIQFSKSCEEMSQIFRQSVTQL
jgi:hypothetical protein